jgi:hypothetical protein
MSAPSNFCAMMDDVGGRGQAQKSELEIVATVHFLTLS